MRNASPLSEQLLIIAVGPPVMAALIAILNRGWARAVAGVLGIGVSETTKREQVWEFWLSLWAMYVIGIGMFVYAHLRR